MGVRCLNAVFLRHSAVRPETLREALRGAVDREEEEEEGEEEEEEAEEEEEEEEIMQAGASHLVSAEG